MFCTFVDFYEQARYVRFLIVWSHDMFYRRIFIICVVLLTQPLQAMPIADETQRAVWVNEAIVATYTYNYLNFMARQKEIAKYYTAQGWINYSKALQESKLPDTIKSNSYYVSAVATLPPDIKPIGANQWQATMPVLVVYTNPSYKQKQTLNIMITFIEAPAGTGVRGFAMTNLQARVSQPECECVKPSSVNAMA